MAISPARHNFDRLFSRFDFILVRYSAYHTFEMKCKRPNLVGEIHKTSTVIN